MDPLFQCFSILTKAIDHLLYRKPSLRLFWSRFLYIRLVNPCWFAVIRLFLTRNWTNLFLRVLSKLFEKVTVRLMFDNFPSYFSLHTYRNKLCYASFKDISTYATFETFIDQICYWFWNVADIFLNSC